MILEAFAAGLLLAAAPDDRQRFVLGRSYEGRPIVVHRRGDFDSPRKILAFGCIHGNECQGVRITRRLLRNPVPAGLDLWIVNRLNPDGHHRRIRQNARGVDLNRNFGAQWIPIGSRWDPYYSGPRRWSERETRLARELVLRVRPDVTIWYHQPQAVVRAWGHSRRTARRYARLAREPYASLRWPNGSAPNWQNHRFRKPSAFVVELPAGRISDARAGRHAGAVRRLLTP